MEKIHRAFSPTNLHWVLTLFVILFICIFLNYKATAQDYQPRIGIKGGMNISNLYVNDVDDESARIGYHVGLFAKMPITSFFAIQPELLYSAKGASAEGGFLGSEYDFNLNYVDLPILAVVNLGPNVNIHGGPYIAYLIGGSFDTDSSVGGTSSDINIDNFNRFDYGVAVGIGFEFGAVSLGARYNLGLNGVGNSGVPGEFMQDSKNQVGQLYIALGL